MTEIAATATVKKLIVKKTAARHHPALCSIRNLIMVTFYTKLTWTTRRSERILMKRVWSVILTLSVIATLFSTTALASNAVTAKATASPVHHALHV